jgi:hypothetical protein
VVRIDTRMPFVKLEHKSHLRDVRTHNREALEEEKSRNGEKVEEI